MNVKRWFKEDKGGFGAFLVLVILVLFFYALQRKDPVDYELNQKQIKELKATKMAVARDSVRVATSSDSGTGIDAEPVKTDSALVALSSVNEPDNYKVKRASTKTKTKVKPKSPRRKLSKEEIVRSKLRAGMTVNQIAKATGYERKYIRAIKKRKVCNCQ